MQIIVSNLRLFKIGFDLNIVENQAVRKSVVINHVLLPYLDVGHQVVGLQDETCESHCTDIV